MPLVLRCDDLQAGMRLAEAFLLRGRTMLPGGKVLTSEDVDILRRKYPDILLKVGDPILDSVVQFENDSKDRDTATVVTHQISSAMADVQKKFAGHTDLGGMDFSRIKSTVASVIDHLKDNPVSAALITKMGSKKNYLAEHAGNVFYLSMVLGSAMKDYVVKERQRQTAANNLSHSLAMDLLPLGLGAMLMDVGMTPLEHMFKPDYELTDDDHHALLDHPRAGADMLPDSLPATAKMIVRWHHENYDGTGYPDRKPGAGLHVFVRIARICDAFDAATSDKVYKKAQSAVRVLWEMSNGSLQKFYDPVLMKVFTSIIQPFPIGGKLQLADGRTAVVVRYNRKSPFHPTAIIAFDEYGHRLPAEKLSPPLNIGDGNNLRLHSFAGENLSYLYETPEPLLAPTHGKRFANLFEAAFP